MYELIGDVDAPAPVLLHSLSGFLDAGHAGRLAVAHLLTSLEHRVVATFDLDDLYDYRARRPRMTFLADHFASVDLPALELVAVRDSMGVEFLLLHGAEPDHAWQRLTSAVRGLVEDLDVRLTIGMHAIPWPAPHSRPVGVTAHATDSSLVAGYAPWVGELEVPGHLAGMIELHLGDTGHQAMGFAAHVPHYLVGAEFPSASVALLEHAARASGLSLPVGELAETAERVRAEIDAQIAANPENVAAVQTLEAQYDAVMSARALEAPTGEQPLPTGDEIAAQVERFLADMDEGTD
jgi:predicted ATP-grasp superfamily ATP-dependent carboligase